jgi:hypothetical protein
MTARRIGGAVLALAGAVVVTLSAYLDWLPSRAPQDMPLDQLVETTLVGEASSYWTSIAVPLAAVTVLAALGAILQSRAVLWLAWLVGLAAAALWLIMRAADDTNAFSIGDLESGFWVCLIGLLVMLLGISSMGAKPVETAEEQLSVMDQDIPEPPPTPRSLP